MSATILDVTNDLQVQYTVVVDIEVRNLSQTHLATVN
jgi:hypothetical protein